MRQWEKDVLMLYGKIPDEKNIWNFRQNMPELIVRDLEKYLRLNIDQKEVVRQILLARGVNKWFKVRRDLIAYKKKVRKAIKALNEVKLQHKKERKITAYVMEREVVKTLEKVRCTLKTLCSSDRLVKWPHSCSRSHLKEMNTIRESD